LPSRTPFSSECTLTLRARDRWSVCVSGAELAVIMSDHDDHHDDRDRITSLADDMTKRTSAPETAHDSPMLQARVRIPDGTDRRQWLKQQSKSRKQKRRSSGDAKRTPSSSSPTASGERFSNHRSPSQDSSQGGDESDTSCSSS
ncbi:unnamed protein product, partial [Scytosiphon promiscuus]